MRLNRNLIGTAVSFPEAALPTRIAEPVAVASSPLHEEAASAAQVRWRSNLRARLGVLRAARYEIARQAESFAEAISPALARTAADTLVTEVLPLLDACRFLERQAGRILGTKKLGRTGRPFWLSGVHAEIRREPVGRVLIIGPGNFPLFLPGVQALQALAAGNQVIWKPGVGGGQVARLFAQVLESAGLPPGMLRVTGEGVEDAEAAIASAPDKVIFTGGSQTGRHILEELAPRLIPATLELSGIDTVIVLSSADLVRTAKALAFGLRLNGGAVCMSPRRVIATGATLRKLRPLLAEHLQTVAPVRLGGVTTRRLQEQLRSAEAEGCVIEGTFEPEVQRPLLVHGATPRTALACTSFFAPVLVMLEVAGDDDVAEVHNVSSYGLTASIFGDEKVARPIADRLRVGSVLINDLIAPTADPRLPFGGRGESGYGVTRGAEGLLDMTVPKVVQVRRNHSTRHFEATTTGDTGLFAGLIRTAHAATWRERFTAMAQVAKAARQRGR